MSDVILRASEVTKIFDGDTEKRKVLDRVSLEVKKGEFLAIMGPSGSGKSTLLFALSGMDPVTDGATFFEKKDLATLRDDEAALLRRSTMGFVFQQPTLLKNLSILDNIVLTAFRNAAVPREEILKKAHKLMKQIGIDRIANNQITQASGGELQRAGICRALINDPEIIFGDEPTGALNSKTSAEIMHIFDTIHEQGITLVVVTHDPKVAARAGRVLFMKDGKIVDEYNKPESVKANNQSTNEAVKRIGEIMEKLSI